MLKNTLINRAATRKIAQALGTLNEKLNQICHGL